MSVLRPVTAAAILAFALGDMAMAQSEPPAPPAPVASQALSIDTPIETLVATPRVKALLDADIPGLTDHPMFDQFKHESLRALAPKFGGAISEKDLAKMQADLAALPLALAAR